jgi:hypothetical protein
MGGPSGFIGATAVAMMSGREPKNTRGSGPPEEKVAVEDAEGSGTQASDEAHSGPQGPSAIDPEGPIFRDPDPRTCRNGGGPADTVEDHLLNRARGGPPTEETNLFERPYEQNARKAGFEGNYAKDKQRLLELGLTEPEAEYVLQDEDAFIRNDVHARPVEDDQLRQAIEGDGVQVPSQMEEWQ